MKKKSNIKKTVLKDTNFVKHFPIPVSLNIAHVYATFDRNVNPGKPC